MAAIRKQNPIMVLSKQIVSGNYFMNERSKSVIKSAKRSQNML